jgi:hypothetical protein
MYYYRKHNGMYYKSYTGVSGEFIVNEVLEEDYNKIDALEKEIPNGFTKEIRRSDL